MMDSCRSEGQWISAAQRLPEFGERVLATDGTFVGEMYINAQGKWLRYNFGNTYNLMVLDVLWWMPLPEPPDHIPNRADRIRSMTDEELVDVILRTESLDELGYCKSYPVCDAAIENNEAEIPESWCRECVVRWLQEPWDERCQ